MSRSTTQYGPLALALVIGLTAGSLGRAAPERFTEIDVERINIVEADGQVRMVIANKARSPAPQHRGAAMGEGGIRPGIIFYNDEETENGGLTFSGRTVDGRVESVGSLTFDQYERDQTVALQTVEAGGTRRAGLGIIDYPGPPTAVIAEMWDSVRAMPEGPARTAAVREVREAAAGRMRMYLGRSRDDGASLVSLHDGNGRTRLRMRVDTLGAAVIEFLDENGNVVRRLEP